MDGMLISIIVFLVVYAAITFELVNKAVATFSGVAVLILLHVIFTQSMERCSQMTGKKKLVVMMQFFSARLEYQISCQTMFLYGALY